MKLVVEVNPPTEKEECPPIAIDGDEKKTDAENKAVEETKVTPPPLQEIVLKVFMHCEGCARKVRRSLKDFEGVKDVVTDCKTHMVVVKGDKADPAKVLERVQRKSHRQVELISPIPKPTVAEEPMKPPEEVPPPEEKKPEMFAVVLKAHMHCEACAEAIKRKIMRMKGVESVEPDFKSSQVTVNGAFDPQTLADYVTKKIGKKVVVVKVEPKVEEKKPAAEEEKKEEGNKADNGEKKENGGGNEDNAPVDEAKLEEGKEDPKMELKKHELFYYYPMQSHYHGNHPLPQQRFSAQQDGGHAYGGYPQMFSDENPNACSVM